ncbi:MAG: sugar phosphate isomerase/epimerase family protein [Candidatus Thermoplasmatota archaeon]|nr:sugar phosphate isomerase/epimerase family protein [Candidatus Thermoplasmatota archaeon]
MSFLFGVKAGWYDVYTMLKLNVDLVEIFIGKRDLIEYNDKTIEIFTGVLENYNVNAVVHAPEYYEDFLVDIASTDVALRNKSIKALQETINFAEQLGIKHIIIHPGGISLKPLDKSQLLKNLKKSLSELNYKRFWLENMPWFYWLENGKLAKSHICVEATDFTELIDEIEGITFDLCHAYLSTKEGGNDKLNYMTDQLKNYIKHIHVSDARAPYHEGLQIGIGDIDFRIMKELPSGIGIVPEIENGYENDGLGFKIALEKLKYIVKSL